MVGMQCGEDPTSSTPGVAGECAGRVGLRLKTCPEVYSAPETMAVPTIRAFPSGLPLLQSICQLHRSNSTQVCSALWGGRMRAGTCWQPPSCAWQKALEGLRDNLTGVSWGNGLHSQLGASSGKKGKQSEPSTPESAPTDPPPNPLSLRDHQWFLMVSETNSEHQPVRGPSSPATRLHTADRSFLSTL